MGVVKGGGSGPRWRGARGAVVFILSHLKPLWELVRGERGGCIGEVAAASCKPPGTRSLTALSEHCQALAAHALQILGDPEPWKTKSDSPKPPDRREAAGMGRGSCWAWGSLVTRLTLLPTATRWAEPGRS